MKTYYIPDLDEEPGDARELTLPSWKTVPTDPKWFAVEAAEYCHSNRDGWEWHWPKVFVILEDGKEVGRFLVDRETVPDFTAHEINPTPESNAEGNTEVKS